MKKLIILIIAVVVIGVASVTIFSSGGLAPSEDSAAGDPVAIVNGEEVSQAEFESLRSQIALEQGFDPASLEGPAVEELNTHIVNSLIAQVLLRQAAAQAGITVSEEDVETQLEIIKGQFESQTAYEEALTAEGVTEEEVRSGVKEGLATEPYLEQELNLSAVTATDAEINAAYDEVSATEEVPPLEEVYDQVRDMVVLQKQQSLVAAHVEELKAGADIEILI